MTRRPSGDQADGTRARHLRVSAADDVLEIDGEQLPLRPRRRLPRWVVWTATLAAVGTGVAGLLIVPTRTWLTQRQQFRLDQQRLEIVQRVNAELDARIEALQTPEEIERIARERYNLVKGGDQVLAVLPAPAPNPLPAMWPYTLLQDIVTVRLTHPESIPTTTLPASATASATASG